MKKFAVILIFCMAIASITALEQKGDLWLLAIGVNDYADNPLYQDLQYAVSDANRIIEAFKAQKGKRFDKVTRALNYR